MIVRKPRLRDAPGRTVSAGRTLRVLVPRASELRGVGWVDTVDERWLEWNGKIRFPMNSGEDNNNRTIHYYHSRIHFSFHSLELPHPSRLQGWERKSFEVMRFRFRVTRC